jgi:hypothetical protein
MKNKKPQSLFLRNFKWISLLLLIIILIFIYFMPRAIVYADFSVIRWAPLFVIFLMLPLFVFTTSISFTKRIRLSTLLAVVSVGIVGPTFGLLQDYREKVELNKYGVWAKTVVIDRKKRRAGGSGQSNWTIKCRYEVNAHIYETLYHDDINNLHPIGDTIKIIYSSRFPKIYALGNEWNK